MHGHMHLAAVLLSGITGSYEECLKRVEYIRRGQHQCVKNSILRRRTSTIVLFKPVVSVAAGTSRQSFTVMKPCHSVHRSSHQGPSGA